MKKIGLTAGISFLAGALFFALTFGFFQDAGKNTLELTPPVVKAQTNSESGTQRIEPIKQVGQGYSFAPLVKRVRSAVVKVTSESLVARGRSTGFNDDFFDRFFRNTPRRGPERRRRVSGTGTGFFISADGYILTNNHVVENAIKIKITDIDKKEFIAKKIGSDPKTDLALLKIEGKNFPYIELGDSDALEVGEWVLAIGNPLGQDLSVTSGIVSAKGRQLSGLEVDYQDFIQTDAAVNQGNSGGPLVDMSGKAVGINSVILSTSGGSIGLGFAIPSNMARKVTEDLKKEGRVIRGYMGVGIYDIPQSEAQDYDLPDGGVLIVSVEADTPAEKAGLKKYDLITHLNGKRVKDSRGLMKKVADHKPGETLTLTIYRGKDKKKVKVKVMEAPRSADTLGQGDGENIVDLGMNLRENSRSLARRYDLSTSEGIVVTEVERGSVAYEHGFRAGDIILAVNRTEIESVSQFNRLVAGKKGSRIFITLNRGGRELFVRFSVPE